ncbi:MAG TPA: cyclic nucleotide-binding domain-containing protein [Polyangiaceae bacterium]
MSETDDRTIMHVRRGSEPPPAPRKELEPIGGIEDVAATVAEFRKTSMDRLEVLGPLAAGGMGTVEIVVDRAIGRRMAKKSMHSMLAGDSRMLRMFLREARTNAQLDHPNVVPVYDVGERDGALYFTMKLVDGRTMKDIIRALEDGPMDPNVLFNLLDVVIKVCDALAFAHARGVVHCDVKPANVMVGDFGEVYLMDWGIARLQGPARKDSSAKIPIEGEEEEADPPSGHTGDAVLGTASYMSPEQAQGNRFLLDARSDVFSVGAIIYEILARRPPYRGESHGETLELARNGTYARPRDLVGESRVPAELERIVLKAMARHRSDRYAGTDELKGDLLRFMRGGAEFPQTTFARGSVIMREGEAGNSAYIIVSGRCEVRKHLNGVQQVLKTLGAGEVFGEMAVLSEGPRTATVVAVEDTTVLVVTGAVLNQELALMKPWMARLLHTQADRIRDIYTTKRVTLGGGPTGPRLANQILMHLTTYGTAGADGSRSLRWSTLSREIEAQMGAPTHTIHMLVARYPEVVLDLDTDEIRVSNLPALAARLRTDLETG